MITTIQKSKNCWRVFSFSVSKMRFQTAATRDSRALIVRWRIRGLNHREMEARWAQMSSVWCERMNAKANILVNPLLAASLSPPSFHRPSLAVSHFQGGLYHFYNSQRFKYSQLWLNYSKKKNKNRGSVWPFINAPCTQTDFGALYWIVLYYCSSLSS